MTAMLNVKDLRAYYGQVQALHGLTFGLNEGSMTTLLGANGAGKTTTLRTIMGLWHASQGSVSFEQREADLGHRGARLPGWISQRDQQGAGLQ